MMGPRARACASLAWRDVSAALRRSLLCAMRAGSTEIAAEEALPRRADSGDLPEAGAPGPTLRMALWEQPVSLGSEDRHTSSSCKRKHNPCSLASSEPKSARIGAASLIGVAVIR